MCSALAAAAPRQRSASAQATAYATALLGRTMIFAGAIAATRATRAIGPTSSTPAPPTAPTLGASAQVFCRGTNAPCTAMRQCTDAGHVGKSALTTIALATMRSSSHARAHHSMHPGGACRCSPGHSGDDCARRTSVNCSVGCSGHGECLDGACACTPGYHGRYCELGCAGYVRLTGQACSGHGVCRPTGSPGRSPDECICHIGFRGEGCEIDADGTLGCERGCSGHGDCLHNRCTCHSGFSGRDCSILLRYSGTAHMMDATTTRLLVALVCLVLTSLCAFCAVRFIESESGKNVYAPQPPVKLKPMAKKVGPGGV